MKNIEFKNEKQQTNETYIEFSKDLTNAILILGSEHNNLDVEQITQNVLNPSEDMDIDIIDTGFDNSVEGNNMGQIYCYLYNGDYSYRFELKRHQHNIAKITSMAICNYLEGKPIRVKFLTKEKVAIGDLIGVIHSMQTKYE